MAGPWEKYAQQPTAPAGDGPWSKYAAPTPSAPGNNIESLIRGTEQAPPADQPSSVKDFVYSAAAGVPRGMVEMGMLPVTAARIVKEGGQSLYDKVAGTTPEEQAQRAADDKDSMLGGFLQRMFDGQDAVRAKMDENLYAPRTTAGKYGRTIGEFVAPSGVAGRVGEAVPTARAAIQNGVENGLGNVVLPAVASEAAGQATEGTPYEGVSRFLAALFGNASVAGYKAVSAPEAFVRRATGDMSPEDWQKAIDLQNNTTGVKLTGPESVAQAKGGASAMPDILRIVEGSVEGRARTVPFFTQRPGQVDAAVGNTLDTIAPQSAQPSTLGPRAADAATNVVRDAEKARTAAVDPLYKAANKDIVPADQVQALLDEIGNVAAADKTGILSGPLGELRDRLTAAPAQPGKPAVRTASEKPNGQIFHTTPAVPATPALPIVDVENLDRARKFFRDKMDLPQIGQDAITKEQNAAVTSVLTKLDDAMMANSPNFAAGKQQYADISRNVVQPLEQGPVGRVAAATDTTGAGNAILPQNPLTGSAGEAADATKRLMTEDPATTAALVRQNLADRHTKATTETQGNNRDFAGAKLHKDVAGNQTRRDVLDAVLRQVSPQAATSMDDLLTVLHATGWRQPVGSRTAFNAAGQEALGSASPAAAMFDIVKSLGGSIINKAGDATKRAALRGNIDTLAKMFIDPNSVELLRAAANNAPKIAFGGAAARSAAETGGTIYDPAGRR